MRYLPTLRYLVILIALACTACGTALPSVKPYKLDIQQGNVVTSKMLLQLRPGMTKSQVRYIMGTPLIQDSFHGNRWDYVYQMREQGKVVEQRRVILDFENELLAKVRGDVTPSTGDKAAAEAGTTNTGTRAINPSAKPAEKGMLDKLKFWKKDEVKPETTKPTDTSPAKEIEKVTPETSKPAEAVQKVEDAVNQAVEAAPSAAEAAPAPASPSLPLESAPVEEGKSILSVPLELPTTPAPVEKMPEVAPAPKAMPKVEAPKAAEPAKPVAVEPVATEPVESIKEKAVEKVLPKEVEMRNAKSEVITPIESKATADKTATENADLPEEDEPGFFDKMLEKIGF